MWSHTDLKQTSKDRVHAFMLMRSSDSGSDATRSYGFEFATEHHYSTGAGYEDGVPRYALQWAMSVDVPEGVSW